MSILPPFVGGKVTVTDGPFSEAKEVIGGYAVFELKSKEEAIETARRKRAKGARSCICRERA